MKYEYHHISKTTDIPTLARKYRELRLKALKAYPASFSSTYELEAGFSDTDWIALITCPGREIFVCVVVPSDSDSNSDIAQSSSEGISEGGEWVGQVTLRGPLPPNEQFDFPLPENEENENERANQSRKHSTENEQQDEEQRGEEEGIEEKECWQMLSLFTLPSHRGQGLGKGLCQEALNYVHLNINLDYGHGYQRDVVPRRVLVRLMVKSENTGAVELYERLRFVRVGRCTLAEAMDANGYGHLVPKEKKEGFEVRNGVVMVFEMRS